MHALDACFLRYCGSSVVRDASAACPTLVSFYSKLYTVWATYKAKEHVVSSSTCRGRGVGEETKSRSGGQPRCGQESPLRLAMILQASGWYVARASEVAGADISRCRCRRRPFRYGVASLRLEGSIFAARRWWQVEIGGEIVHARMRSCSSCRSIAGSCIGVVVLL